MDEKSRELRTDQAARPAERPTRWWGLAVGALGGLLDTASTLWLGIRFEMNGADVTLLRSGWLRGHLRRPRYLFGLVLEAPATRPRMPRR